MKTARLLRALAPALALLFGADAGGQTKCKPIPEGADFSFTLALHQRFVRTYKDRALITTNFNVDRYPPRPHPIGRSGSDGDIHLAGRDDVIRLPLVAEIMNPRYFQTLSESEAQDFMALFRSISADEPVGVTGVWRLWFEHPGETQVMGAPVAVPADTSPPHVFEIHPVTEFKGIDTLPSFIPIKGYKKNPAGELKSYEAHPGSLTVPYYECLPSSITAEDMGDGRAGIVIASKKAQYNYTDLIIKLYGNPQERDDCYMVLADIYDSPELETKLTNEPRRMIFVKGSPPAAELREQRYRKGDTLRVLGIPRINLTRVYAVARESGGEPLTDFLPYEMIVAALLDPEE